MKEAFVLRAIRQIYILIYLTLDLDSDVTSMIRSEAYVIIYTHLPNIVPNMNTLRQVQYVNVVSIDNLERHEH